MGPVDSKSTAQGQIPVPAERYTSKDLHRALFDTPPTPCRLKDLKEGIATYMRQRRSRGTELVR
jgi:hypothetical protein